MSAYTVHITPSALYEMKHLPGHVRQRAKRAVDGLERDPRPAGSAALNLSGVELPAEIQAEVWRLRMDNRRVVYAITEADKVVDVLAIRKRPPYDYGDLKRLLEGN